MAYTPPLFNAADLTFVGTYTPPEFNAADLYFTSDAGITLYQTWTDSTYVYAAKSNGLDIYDITSESVYAYINYTGGFTTVWANDDRVFIGTADDGVKYIEKACISGSISVPISLDGCLHDFNIYPGTITDTNVRYIHGSGATVMVLTVSGIDIMKYDFQGYHSYTIVTDGTKCFLTSQNKGYYIIDSGDSWSLNRIDSSLHDWTTPDYSYITGSGIFPGSVSLSDVFVTEGTSTDSISNVLFTATSSGIYVIDEEFNYYNNYDTLFTNESINFTAAWADPTTSLNSGKFYVASSDSFYVVDASTSGIYDYYTQTHVGRANESLEAEDIIDINVGE